MGAELFHFSTFLLGFSSLFPLINPIGTAFIIQPYFANFDDATRRRDATRIALICFVMGLVVLHVGSYVLKFMECRSRPRKQQAESLSRYWDSIS